jgi:hypothetical protein
MAWLCKRNVGRACARSMATGDIPGLLMALRVVQEAARVRKGSHESMVPICELSIIEF